jgi:hypothetical protein
LTFSQQKERNRKLDSAQKDTSAAVRSESAKDEKTKKKRRRRPALPRHEVPFHRSVSRRPLADRRWNSRRPHHLLFRRHRRRRLEIHRRRQHLVSRFSIETEPPIGSIAVAASDPNVVYVGTGEACIRGNISQGDGVWKSVDAGKSWKNVRPERFARHRQSDRESAQSRYRFRSRARSSLRTQHERGVFRTTDGGKTWDKVLYKDENTGAIDLAFDPQNPNILFASLWERAALPGRFRAVARAAASTVPPMPAQPGKTGRARPSQGSLRPHRLAVAANSERVYAIIEAKENGGLYRSDDGGDTWDLVNGSHGLLQRAWYYMHVIADPQDAEHGLRGRCGVLQVHRRWPQLQ